MRKAAVLLDGFQNRLDLFGIEFGDGYDRGGRAGEIAQNLFVMRHIAPLSKLESDIVHDADKAESHGKVELVAFLIRLGDFAVSAADALERKQVKKFFVNDASKAAPAEILREIHGKLHRPCIRFACEKSACVCVAYRLAVFFAYDERIHANALFDAFAELFHARARAFERDRCFDIRRVNGLECFGVCGGGQAERIYEFAHAGPFENECEIGKGR